jgi:hypothetical protein
MGDVIYNNFEEFLKGKGINKVNNFDKEQSSINKMLTKSIVQNQLEVISEFHFKTMGFSEYISKRLENHTGKKVEEYKVYVKKLKRDIKKIHNEGVQNHVEELILQYSDNFIERAERCINSIYAVDYYKLINRSMKRIEICIGDGYHTNLRKNCGVIEFINIGEAGYNMIECDAIYYLSKLKKKGLEFDWKELISKYCDYESLDIASEIFVMSMLSYPHEFMRSINRYRYKKKDWTEKEYSENIISAIEKDGESLL